MTLAEREAYEEQQRKSAIKKRNETCRKIRTQFDETNQLFDKQQMNTLTPLIGLHVKNETLMNRRPSN